MEIRGAQKLRLKNTVPKLGSYKYGGMSEDQWMRLPVNLMNIVEQAFRGIKDHSLAREGVI